MAIKPLATALQKENFKIKFAELVSKNELLKEKITIQFFDTTRSNYVIKGSDGKSINVMALLNDEELEQYRALKKNWRD
jgi:hypothetical protein